MKALSKDAFEMQGDSIKVESAPGRMESDGKSPSFPLSPLQQGMLFHRLYAGHSGVDISQIICIWHEEVDGSLFDKAWQLVAERHPIVRTAFNWEDAQLSIGKGWNRPASASTKEC
jgi:hypothetical protein